MVLGQFYAPHQPDDSVLGLCSDPDNEVLITGDSVGQVSVWDIHDYCVGSQSEVSKSISSLQQKLKITANLCQQLIVNNLVEILGLIDKLNTLC